MSGYTPLFSSLTRGTLCGKWPDIGLWPVLLSMTDWRGEIDATPQYIAGVTGLPLTEVIECIGRFCDPDLGSRCTEAEGARLVLIDPENRSWGWRVVNIQVYRDKASDMKQVADGRNAEKVRRYKERHKDTAGHCETPPDTDGHRQIPPDTDSNSNSNSNSNENQDKKPRATRSAGYRLPEGWKPNPECLEFAQALGVDADALLQEFSDYWRGVPGARGRKLDWEGTWRNRCREVASRPSRPFAKPKRRAKTADELDAEWEAANAKQ